MVDTGPVAGETFEQKVARLKAVAAAAKQRAEEGGSESVGAVAPDSPVAAEVLESAMIPPPEPRKLRARSSAFRSSSRGYA